jgi:hypothetical protein
MSWLLKAMGVRPEQLVSAVLDSIKKMSDGDAVQLAEFVAKICVSDKAACVKIWRLSLLIANTCKYSLEGGESGGEREEEEGKGG